MKFPFFTPNLPPMESPLTIPFIMHECGRAVVAIRSSTSKATTMEVTLFWKFPAVKFVQSKCVLHVPPKAHVLAVFCVRVVSFIALVADPLSSLALGGVMPRIAQLGKSPSVLYVSERCDANVESAKISIAFPVLR